MWVTKFTDYDSRLDLYQDKQDEINGLILRSIDK